ncbi:MAG: hypothetical protein ACR2GQ_05145 [Gemmatimonadota bacterium]
MAGVNRTGVMAGGLTAGVILVASGLGLGLFVILPEARPLIAEGYSPSPAIPLLFRLGLGFVLVWAYAGLRPRYGVGARSVLAAALTVWAAATVGVVSIASMFPTLSPLTAALVVVWGLIECVGAGLAGAAIYRRLAAARARRRGKSVGEPVV